MSELICDPFTMSASFPVFRSGLVLESTLNLTPAQAQAGIDFMNEYREDYTGVFRSTLLHAGATDPKVQEYRDVPNIQDEALIGRTIKFSDITFSFEGYFMECRVGVTICEGSRKSKIAVRVIGLQTKDGDARALSSLRVSSLLDACQTIGEKLTAETATIYESLLAKFVDQNIDEINFIDGATEFSVASDFSFTLRAFDSGDEKAFELIDDLGDGERLSEMLNQPDYKRVFENLWNVAYNQGAALEMDVHSVLKELRDNENHRVTVMEKPFIDAMDRDRIEQRALVVSKLVKGVDGPDKMDFTAVACEPLFKIDPVPGVNRDSAAFRMSGHLFASYASRF